MALTSETRYESIALEEGGLANVVIRRDILEDGVFIGFVDRKRRAYSLEDSLSDLPAQLRSFLTSWRNYNR